MVRNQKRGIEWDCQKTLRQYYHYVDHHEYEDAVKLFTEDADWKVMGLSLKGRDEILEALYGGLGVFMRNPDKPMAIHTWADEADKVAGDA